MEGRATLLITHRLAGLETMDTIVVLDGGRVVEQGRHDQLLRRGGYYRHMWEQQSAGEPNQATTRAAGTLQAAR